MIAYIDLRNQTTATPCFSSTWPTDTSDPCSYVCGTSHSEWDEKEERARIRAANIADHRAFVASLHKKREAVCYQPPRLAQREHFTWRRGPERRAKRRRNWW